MCLSENHHSETTYCAAKCPIEYFLKFTEFLRFSGHPKQKQKTAQDHHDLLDWKAGTTQIFAVRGEVHLYYECLY